MWSKKNSQRSIFALESDKDLEKHLDIGDTIRVTWTFKRLLTQ